MTRAQQGDENHAGTTAGAKASAGAGPHTSTPDTQLTALIRADAATAYPALRELRLRHRPAVLAYARLCAMDEPGARRLTAQAFALAARETARGVEPRGPWRHKLLLLVTRVAAAWATDDRGNRLHPDLLTHLRETSADDREPPMLAAFHSLPTRVQGLVWYTVVDEEPDAGAAVYLGFTPQDVRYGKEPAFQSLRQACLKARLADSGDPRCQGFRRLIEEAVRPDIRGTEWIWTPTSRSARTAPPRTRNSARCGTPRVPRWRTGCWCGAARPTRRTDPPRLDVLPGAPGLPGTPGPGPPRQWPGCRRDASGSRRRRSASRWLPC